MPKPPLPVDRGWAWWVTVGYFINLYITISWIRGLAILLPIFLDKYQQSTAVTTLAFGISELVESLSHVLLSLVFINRYSVRSLTLFGAIANVLAILSLCISSNIVLLNVAFGVIGVARGFMLNPQVYLLGGYFKKRLSFASSVGNTGTSVATLLGPLVTQLLLTSYGLQGTFLMCAGIATHSIISSLLFRPTSLYSGSEIGYNVSKDHDNDVHGEDRIDALPSSNSSSSLSLPKGVFYDIKDRIIKTKVTTNMIPSTSEPESQTTTSHINDVYSDKIGCQNQSTMSHQQDVTNCNNEKTTPSALTLFKDSELSKHQYNNNNETTEIEKIEDQFNGYIMSPSGCNNTPRNYNHTSKEFNTSYKSYKKDSPVTTAELGSDNDPLDQQGPNQNYPNSTGDIVTETFPAEDSPFLKTLDDIERERSANTDYKRNNTEKISTASHHGEEVVVEEEESIATDKKQPTVTAWEVMRNPTAVLITMAGIFGTQTQCGSVYMPVLGLENGLHSEQLPWLLTIGGTSDIVGKIVFGFVADRRWLQPITIACLSLFNAGVVFQLVTYFQGMASMATLCIIYGFHAGMIQALLSPITVEYVGLPSLPHITSGMFLGNCVLTFLAHLVIGTLRDHTGSFRWGFRFVGALMLTAAVFLLVARWWSGQRRPPTDELCRRVKIKCKHKK